MIPTGDVIALFAVAILAIIVISVRNAK